MLAETLTRLLKRASDPEYDPRHGILDVSAELLALADATEPMPEHLRNEWSELLNEIRAIQPVFPSRRNTSPLFDRASLGRTGHERAQRLIQRLSALTASLRRNENPRESGQSTSRYERA